MADLVRQYLQSKGVPLTPENMARASQFVAQHPEIAEAAAFGLRKTNDDTNMTMEPDFGMNLTGEPKSGAMPPPPVGVTAMASPGPQPEAMPQQRGVAQPKPLPVTQAGPADPGFYGNVPPGQVHPVDERPSGSNITDFIPWLSALLMKPLADASRRNAARGGAGEGRAVGGTVGSGLPGGNWEGPTKIPSGVQPEQLEPPRKQLTGPQAAAEGATAGGDAGRMVAEAVPQAQARIADGNTPKLAYSGEGYDAALKLRSQTEGAKGMSSADRNLIAQAADDLEQTGKVNPNTFKQLPYVRQQWLYKQLQQAGVDPSMLEQFKPQVRTSGDILKETMKKRAR